MKMRVETLMPSKEPDGANARANLQISISLITPDLLLFGDDEGVFSSLCSYRNFTIIHSGLV